MNPNDISFEESLSRELELLILKAKIQKVIQSRSRRGKIYHKKVWVNLSEPPSSHSRKGGRQPRKQKNRFRNQVQKPVDDMKLLMEIPEFRSSMKKFERLPPRRRQEIEDHSEVLELSHIEQSILFHYTTREGNHQMNSKLRERRKLSKAEDLIVEHLDQALKKLPKVAGIVFRKISIPPGKAMNHFLAKYHLGNNIWENQYVSTSFDEDHARERDGNILFVIHQESGVNLEPLSCYRNEREILIPRRRQFRIKEIDRRKYPIIIEMEEVIDHGSTHR